MGLKITLNLRHSIIFLKQDTIIGDGEYSFLMLSIPPGYG